MSFWYSERPVARRNSSWDYSRVSNNGGQGYYSLTIPVFSFSDVVWNISSIILVEFSLTMSHNFSLLKPIVAPPGVNFCLAVRWGSGASVTRYKLWENVGENLDYPLYNNQIIPASGAFLEAWSTEDSSEVSLSSALNLRTSIMIPRGSCCENGDSYTPLVGDSILFNPLDPDTEIPIPRTIPYLTP